MLTRLSASISALFRPSVPSAFVQKTRQATVPYFARLNAAGSEPGKRLTLRQVSPLDVSPLDDDFAIAPEFVKSDAARAGLRTGLESFPACNSLVTLSKTFGEQYRLFSNSEESGERRRDYAHGLACAIRELQELGRAPWGEKQDLIVGSALVASNVSKVNIGGDAYAGRLLAACDDVSDLEQLRGLLSKARLNRTTPLSEDAQLAVMKKAFERCAAKDRLSCVQLLKEFRSDPENALCMWTLSTQVNEAFKGFEAAAMTESRRSVIGAANEGTAANS